MQIKNLDKQLRCPYGEDALKVADIMNQSNHEMITKTIELLPQTKKVNILEIGHGSGKHIGDVLSHNKTSHYTGLELSAEMYNESIENNRIHIDQDRAQFRLYDGNVLPFVDHNFDVVFTINTIYFWDEAKIFLEEIKRIVSPSGMIYITFLLKETTSKQPFLDDDFQHYSYDLFLNLVNSCGLKVNRFSLNQENGINKMGKHIDRYYGIFQLIQ